MWTHDEFPNFVAVVFFCNISVFGTNFDFEQSVYDAKWHISKYSGPYNHIKIWYLRVNTLLIIGNSS